MVVVVRVVVVVVVRVVVPVVVCVFVVAVAPPLLRCCVWLLRMFVGASSRVMCQCDDPVYAGACWCVGAAAADEPDNAEFWSTLGGDASHVAPADAAGDDETVSKTTEAKLFHVSNETGEMVVNEVAPEVSRPSPPPSPNAVCPRDPVWLRAPRQGPAF